MAESDGRGARFGEGRKAILHSSPYELVPCICSAGRCGYGEVDAETRIRDKHVVEDVVGVSDPSYFEACEGGEVGRGGRRGVDLEHGLEVGKDLGWMVASG